MKNREKLYKFCSVCLVVTMLCLPYPSIAYGVGESPPNNVQQESTTDQTPPDATAGSTTPPDTTAGSTTPPDTTAGSTIPPDTTAGSTTPPDTTAGSTTPPDTTAGSTTPPDTTAGSTTPPDTTLGSMTPPDATLDATTPPVPTLKDDLVVAFTVKEGEIQTPLLDESKYEGHDDTYAPGMDRTSANTIAGGNAISYPVSIALSSKSGTKYSVDSMAIKLCDETGQPIDELTVPVYALNAQDNADCSTLRSEMTATMHVVTLNTPELGSTASTDIVINLGDKTYWNSQITPKVCLVITKGQETFVQSLDLPMVKLTSQGTIGYQISQKAEDLEQLDNLQLVTKNGQSGFEIPFSIQTNLGTKDGYNALGDLPSFEAVTYQYRVSDVIVGGQTVDLTALTADMFSFKAEHGKNMTVTGWTYADGLLSITAKPTDSAKTDPLVKPYEVIKGTVFLPLVTNQQVNSVRTAFQLTPNTDNSTLPAGVQYENFANARLFVEHKQGALKFDKTLTVYNQDANAVTTLMLKSIIDAPVQKGETYMKTAATIQHELTGINAELLRNNNLVAAEILDSPILGFAEGGSITIDYVDKSGQKLTVPVTDYTVTYGYAPLLKNADIPQALQATSAEYAKVAPEGYVPNIKVFRITQNPLAGLTVDWTKPVTIHFNESQVARASNGVLATAWPFGNGSSKSSTINLRSYSSLDTGSALADAQKAYIPLASSVDSLTAVGSTTWLNLGTTEIGKSPYVPSVNRFNAVSQVNDQFSFMHLTESYQVGLYAADGTQVQTVHDYTQSYNLRLKRADKSYIYGATVLQAGMKVTLTVPDAMRPFVQVNTTAPYVISGGSKMAVTDCHYVNGQITLTIPADVVMENRDMTCGVYVPLTFMAPFAQTNANNFPVTLDRDKCVWSKSDNVMDGMGADSGFLRLGITDVPTAWVGQTGDNGHLGILTDTTYHTGESVQYAALVYNDEKKSGDFYLALTVPEADYNITIASQADIRGYITGIAPHDATEIYYQTATKATVADKAMMKSLNGTSMLADYYSGTIKGSWTLYSENTPLPADVVMLVAYQRNMAAKAIMQVDYTVQMQVPDGSQEVYTNVAALKYYSSLSGKEASSNTISINNVVGTTPPVNPPVNPPINPPVNPPVNLPTDPPVTSPTDPVNPSTPGNSDDPAVLPDQVTKEPDVSEPPTPATPPDDGEVIISDEAVPLAQAPMMPPGSPDQETVLIADEQVPLADRPPLISTIADQPETITIIDGAVPLGNLPKTGSDGLSIVSVLGLLMMGGGLLLARHKKIKN